MTDKTFEGAIEVLGRDVLPVEPAAPPKRRCQSCRAELAEAEDQKCGPCVESERRVPRPTCPGHADAMKFAAWVKADMEWKQNPKRELV